MPAILEGFGSTERRGPDGSIETEQRVPAPHAVVPISDEGGKTLGRCYWLAVSRASKGLVRSREGEYGVVLDLLGFGPRLLRLGPAEVTVERDRVSCRYPIHGGLLSRRPDGTLTVSQVGRDRPELRVAVSGFFARLGGRPGFPRWSGALYEQLQRRLHVAVSRRYFSDLMARDPL